MRSILIPALLLAAAPAAAQDTLRLPDLQRRAVAHDPRTRQAALNEQATRLRLQNLDAERLPQLGVRGDATRQSEVASIPIQLPNVDPPTPPKSRLEVGLDAQVTLYDGGTRGRRREAERAQLQLNQAQLAATLFPLRAEVNEAFFTAFLMQERLRETESLVTDLEARLGVVRERVRAGAALPGDTAAIRAQLLRAGQDRTQLAAERRAALRILGELTGRDASADDVLALPELAASVAEARAGEAAHPQYAVFAAQRERLRRDEALAGGRNRPQVAAFGQVNYGRPGLAQFREDLHEYWLAGVRMRWTPWDWGTSRRDQAALRLQRQAVDTEEAAFSGRLRRQVADELETMRRLEDGLDVDDRIVALRAQVERQARAQFDERAITADAYVDARTDLQEARVTRDRHRVELARARAQYLTTLGMDLP